MPLGMELENWLLSRVLDLCQLRQRSDEIEGKEEVEEEEEEMRPPAEDWLGNITVEFNS